MLRGDQGFVGPETCTTFGGPSFKEKNTKLCTTVNIYLGLRKGSAQLRVLNVKLHQPHGKSALMKLLANRIK